MNDLPIHITPHGIDLSFALRKFIEKKISRLPRFAGDILSAEVVLREKSGANGLFSVSARLALPGRDVHGNAVHKNFYAAINQLVAQAENTVRETHSSRWQVAVQGLVLNAGCGKIASREAYRKAIGTINYES